MQAQMPRVSLRRVLRQSDASPDELRLRPQVRRQVAQLPERLQGQLRERAPQHPVS
jgi:hypothetical protein